MRARGVSEIERESGANEDEGIILIPRNGCVRELGSDRVTVTAMVKAEVRPKQKMRVHLSPSQGQSQQHQTSIIYRVTDKLIYNDQT